ncbi:MAG: tyrosine--tRNA ligase [Patescibacteria group bacterium]
MFGFAANKKALIPKENEVGEFLSRGVAEVVDRNEFRKLLLGGKPLRIKLGIDPTSPNIHLGRAAVLWKLKKLQDWGHKIVLIVGDFTGVIGDSSDKESERPMLSKEEVEQNMKNYFSQMGKIINLASAEQYHNSKWLSRITYAELGAQADRFSLSDFIARENIKRRLDKGTRVSLRELLYPLMQGYDSVAVKADIEFGGTDQRFNLLSGRTLQTYYKQKPQQLMTLELLPGLDGRKMSSSWGNTININDSAENMYGKTMRLPDSLVKIYFKLATNLPMDEIESAMASLRENKIHPKEVKMKLARTITAMYYGQKVAIETEQNFVKKFTEGVEAENIPTEKLIGSELLVDVFLRAKVIESKSEFARLVSSGSIEILGGPKIVNGKAPALRKTYRIGKHRFLKII